MSKRIDPKIGEIVDVPGIGRCEFAEELLACHHATGPCAMRLKDKGEAWFVCNTREELSNYVCSHGCYRKLEDHE